MTTPKRGAVRRLSGSDGSPMPSPRLNLNESGLITEEEPPELVEEQIDGLLDENKKLSVSDKS